jgi:hypothetical protein
MPYFCAFVLRSLMREERMVSNAQMAASADASASVAYEEDFM